MIHCRSNSESDTTAIAAAVAHLARPGDMIILSGEMGAGKTAFVRGFAAALGVTEEDEVASPTFVLVHTYTTGRTPIHHADLYRLGTLGEVADLGLREMVDMGAIAVVEWGDVAIEVLGECLVITLTHDEDDLDARDIDIRVEGHGWDTRWDRLRGALTKWAES